MIERDLRDLKVGQALMELYGISVCIVLGVEEFLNHTFEFTSDIESDIACAISFPSGGGTAFPMHWLVFLGG
jgi:hypothetical protein